MGFLVGGIHPLEVADFGASCSVRVSVRTYLLSHALSPISAYERAAAFGL